MEEMQINWLALLVAAISTLVVGFIWYNPKVFGTIWMKEIGMTEDKAKESNMILTFGLTVVFTFLAAIFLWGNVMMGGPEGMEHGTAPFMTFKHGALHGAIVGLFLALPIIVVNGLFEQRSFKYIMVVAGYWIATFALMGGIINAWP